MEKSSEHTAALQADMAKLATAHARLLDGSPHSVVLTLYMRGWVGTAWLAREFSVRPADGVSSDYYPDPAAALADLDRRLIATAARAPEPERKSAPLGTGEAA